MRRAIHAFKTSEYWTSRVLGRHGWPTIIHLNKKGGVVVSVSTNSSIIQGEDIKEYQPPSEEAAAVAKKTSKVAPLCNYPGEGFIHITEAVYLKVHKDYRFNKNLESATYSKHRVRHANSRSIGQEGWGSFPFT